MHSMTQNTFQAAYSQHDLGEFKGLKWTVPTVEFKEIIMVHEACLFMVHSLYEVLSKMLIVLE